MSAYSELYLQDSIELMEATFMQVSSEEKWNFEIFVKGFMNSKYRRFWDEGNPRIINMPYDELLAYLHRYCPDIFVEGECEVDPLLAGWIGEIYNRIQFKTNMSSSKIYEKIPLDSIMRMFYPLHEVDEDVAVDKIIKGMKLPIIPNESQ